jgi:hypothetical protein
MPTAQLPKNFKGWIVAILSSLVGFVSGLFAIRVLTRLWK